MSPKITLSVPPPPLVTIPSPVQVTCPPGTTQASSGPITPEAPAQSVKTSTIEAQSAQTPLVQSSQDKIPPVEVQPSDGEIEAGDKLTIDEGGEEDALLNTADDHSIITDASQITDLLNDIQKYKKNLLFCSVYNL